MKEENNFLNLNLLLQGFKQVALYLVQKNAINIQNENSLGKENFNNHLVNFIELVHSHINYYILESFVKVIENTKDEALNNILKDLCLLYANSTIKKFAASFIESNVLNSTSISILNNLILVLNKRVRKFAIPLVDAFAIPDFILISPLGKYDGNIYNSYLDAIKNSRGGSDITPPYWEQIVKPRVWNGKRYY